MILLETCIEISEFIYVTIDRDLFPGMLAVLATLLFNADKTSTAFACMTMVHIQAFSVWMSCAWRYTADRHPDNELVNAASFIEFFADGVQCACYAPYRVTDGPCDFVVVVHFVISFLF